DVHAEERREAVEVALAVLVVDVDALAARDDRHLVLFVVGAHAREVQPQVAAGELLIRAAGRSLLGGGHGEVSPPGRRTRWSRWWGPPRRPAGRGRTRRRRRPRRRRRR